MCYTKSTTVIYLYFTQMHDSITMNVLSHIPEPAAVVYVVYIIHKGVLS